MSFVSTKTATQTRRREQGSFKGYQTICEVNSVVQQMHRPLQYRDITGVSSEFAYDLLIYLLFDLICIGQNIKTWLAL